MNKSSSRGAPPVKEQRAAFRSEPSKTNQGWATEWGISRERVRQLRKALGLAPSSQIQRQIRAEKKARDDAAKAIDKARLSDRICPVDAAPVPVSRDLTCSSKCAGVYRSTFLYRVNR